MKSRRGLSTVVGAIFFVIVMASTIGYVSYSIGLIDTLAKSIEVKQTLDFDRTTEEFEVTGISTVSNEFNITLQNTGKIPIKVTRLWVENMSDPSLQNLRYSINDVAGPGQTITNIGQGIGLVALDTQAYQMKLVTERGNSEEFIVNSPAVQPLKMQLFANPDLVPEKFHSTLRFTVQNNMSSKSTLFNLVPTMQASPTGGATLTSLAGPIPSSYDSLKSGDVAEFTWVYELDGNDGSGGTFTASVQNSFPGNDAVETINIKTVEVSLESGVSLETTGFTNPSSVKDILYLHNETDRTPSNNEYQLDSRAPDSSGTTISINQLDKSFFTRNGTNDVDIPAGTWNFTATYFSNLVPIGIPEPDLAFHFSCDGCGGGDDTVNSSGKTPDMDKAGFGNAPIYQTSGGPDNSAYYQFIGDRMTDEWDVNGGTYSQYGEPQADPDSTAVWVRVPSVGTDNYMTIVRFGDAGNDPVDCDNQPYDDRYEISVGDDTSPDKGKIVFSYQTNNVCPSAPDETRCESDSRLDDNTWHHVVAVRPSDDTCTLYIDGVKQADEDTSSGTFPGNSVDIDFIGISYDNRNTSSELTGDVDAFLHWNNYALSAQQAQDLYHTNYGTNGTRLHFVSDRTDQDGNFVSNIQTDNPYSMDFIDPATKSTSSTTYTIQTSNTTANKYGIYNYTWTETGWVNFTAGQRLNFSINWINDAQNLPLNLRIDGVGFTLPDGPSFIQLGGLPVNGFISYIFFIEGEQPVITLTNLGPDGMWLTFVGTRLTFDSLSTSDSYAGALHQVNGTTVSETADSIFVDVGEFVDLLFYIPNDAPDRATSPGPGQIPQGIFDGNMYISGYDDKGVSFLRTILFGESEVGPP